MATGWASRDGLARPTRRLDLAQNRRREPVEVARVHVMRAIEGLTAVTRRRSHGEDLRHHRCVVAQRRLAKRTYAAARRCDVGVLNRYVGDVGAVLKLGLLRQRTAANASSVGRDAMSPSGAGCSTRGSGPTCRAWPRVRAQGVCEGRSTARRHALIAPDRARCAPGRAGHRPVRRGVRRRARVPIVLPTANSWPPTSWCSSCDRRWSTSPRISRKCLRSSTGSRARLLFAAGILVRGMVVYGVLVDDEPSSSWTSTS